MSNAFDQFDTPPVPAAPANPFDKFDAPTPLGQKLEQTWPVQLAEQVYRGLMLPGDVASGKTDVTPAKAGMWSDEDEARLQATNGAIADRASSLAQIATPASAATRAGVGVAGVPISAKVVPKFPSAPTVDQLYHAAEGDYAVARAMDVNVHPSSVGNFAQTLQAQMERDGLRDYLAPKTFNALKEMQGAGNAAAGAAASGATPLTNLADIDGMRRVLGHAAGDFTNPTEQYAANRAIQALDKYVGSVPTSDIISGDPAAAQKVLESARGNYAAAKRAELIESQQEKAERQAGVTGAGANINNALRQKMNQILNNKSMQRGFSDDELDQINQIATGTPIGNLARKIGKLAPTGVVSGALGLDIGSTLLTGVPLGATIPALAGSVAKKVGEASTTKGIDALSEAVRARSPLAAQLRQIQKTLPAKSGTPPAAIVSSALSAARRLPISGLQSPAVAYGGDNQQNVPGPPSQ